MGKPQKTFSATGLVLSILNTTMFLSPVLKHTDLNTGSIRQVRSWQHYCLSSVARFRAIILRRKRCSTRTRSCLDKYTPGTACPLCACSMHDSLHLPEATVPGTLFPKYSRIRSSSMVSKAFQNSRSGCRPFLIAFAPREFFKMRVFRALNPPPSTTISLGLICVINVSNLVLSVPSTKLAKLDSAIAVSTNATPNCVGRCSSPSRFS